jgi:hypothetical protein
MYEALFARVDVVVTAHHQRTQYIPNERDDFHRRAEGFGGVLPVSDITRNQQRRAAAAMTTRSQLEMLSPEADKMHGLQGTTFSTQRPEGKDFESPCV